MLNVKSENITTSEKIFNFLTQDNLYISMFNSLIDKLNTFQEKKKKNVSKFYGCRENTLELFDYYQENNIAPVNIIDNMDGTVTHIYEDGTKIILNITLTGIPKNLSLVKKK